MNGPTINFGAFSKDDITDPVALAKVASRAVDLGVHLHVLPTNRRWAYRVRAFSDAFSAEGRDYDLVVAMAIALDKYEIELDEHTWTNEELLTIANQSGIEVSRA